MNVTTIKKRVRERDGQRCTKCGMTAEEHREKFGRKLDVHRTTPGSEYSVEGDACVTICAPCHRLEPKLPPGQRGPKRPGMSTLYIEVPIDVCPHIEQAARTAGESLTVFVVRAAAKRAKVPYAAPTRGRPKKDGKGKPP